MASDRRNAAAKERIGSSEDQAELCGRGCSFTERASFQSVEAQTIIAKRPPASHADSFGDEFTDTPKRNAREVESFETLGQVTRRIAERIGGGRAGEEISSPASCVAQSSQGGENSRPASRRRRNGELG